jgi:hypothetical protein
MLRAIFTEDIERIRFLIASGKAGDLDGTMELAVATGNIFIVKLLESGGASFSRCLIVAAAFWHSDLFDWIWTHDHRHEGYWSYWLLDLCVRANFYHGVKFCLEHLRCVLSEGTMQYAVETSNLTMFRLLLHFPGASIDAQMTEMALFGAIQKQDKKMIRFVWGFNRFVKLCPTPSDPPVIQYLSRGYDEDEPPDTYWDEPLRLFVVMAISTKSLDIFEFVLSELDAYDVMDGAESSGKPPEDVVDDIFAGLLGSDDPKFIRRILDFQKVIPDCSLLPMAVRRNAFPLLDIITNGDPNYFRWIQQSPFPECETVAMAQYLFDHGARAETVGEDGKSCLGRAILNENTELIDFLLERGVRPMPGDPRLPDDPRLRYDVPF